jgi:predicted lipoprotein with Yx(FWY)xxD motif
MPVARTRVRSTRMMRFALALVIAFAAVPASATASTVKISHSRYGDILVDGKGRTLYLFTKERTRKPRCYGNCAQAWPPFFAKGTPQAGKGADARRLGTTKRRNGRRQMTYGGHPLYYYVADRKAGQITCQDVTEFGGTWLLVSKPGDAVR